VPTLYLSSSSREGSGRIRMEQFLPVLVQETSRDLIDEYLKAVVMLEPRGSPAAEVAYHVSELQKDDARCAIQKFQNQHEADRRSEA
jgi:hypothetical protein